MKALITAPFAKEEVNRLSEYMQVELCGWGKDGVELSKKELLEKIPDYDIFISEMEFADRDVIDAGKRLKLIGSVRGTPFNIDSAYAKERGIVSLFAPGRNAVGVAELTIFLMGELVRNITISNEYLRRGEWDESDEMSYVKFRGTELCGKTLGLLGLGAIGTRVARIANAFHMNVQCYDPYLNPENAKELHVKQTGLEELFETSDFISVHCRVTPQTTGMLDYALFSKMKPTAFFINTARSAVTKEADLRRILREGKIAGAALDVFDKEPMGQNPDWLSLQNCYLVPHIGGATHEVVSHHSRIMADDLIRFAKGEPPINVL